MIRIRIIIFQSQSQSQSQNHFIYHNKVTPVWGDFMFSVRFRRVRVHVRRRKNFSLSRQNRSSWNFDIRHKEYMGLGKCTGWPFPAVASISKNLLVCAIKWEPLIGSLQNMAALLP